MVSSAARNSLHYRHIIPLCYHTSFNTFWVFFSFHLLFTIIYPFADALSLHSRFIITRWQHPNLIHRPLSTKSVLKSHILIKFCFFAPFFFSKPHSFLRRPGSPHFLPPISIITLHTADKPSITEPNNSDCHLNPNKFTPRPNNQLPNASPLPQQKSNTKAHKRHPP